MATLASDGGPRASQGCPRAHPSNGAVMRVKVMLATVAVVAASVVFPTVAAGTTTSAGALWGGSSTGTASTAQDCGSGGGSRSVDTNQFCVIDDVGPVELGVRFTST